jgi:hypothetical protein
MSLSRSPRTVTVVAPVTARLIILVMLSFSLETSLAFLPAITSVGPTFTFRHQTSRLATGASIDGLQSKEEFRRYDQVARTLAFLANQLPLLLLKPLATNNAIVVYSPDVVLMGPRGEELSTSLDELVSLSSTLVAATAATRQANSLATTLSNAIPGERELDFGVKCEFVLNPASLHCFQVKWEAPFLGGGLSTSKVQGLSELTLNPDGRVSAHRLVNVEIDGREINAVGEALATLRRAVKSASALFQNVPFAPMLNELMEELLRVPSPNTIVPPTWVVAVHGAGTNATTIALDQYNSSLPLPGSSSWKNYSDSYKALTRFVNSGIPVLSNSPSKESVNQLFAAQAQLCGIDGIALCTGGTQVAAFYRTLASLRQGTLGNWNVQNVVGDWRTRSIMVSWSARNPIAIRGKDCFRLDSAGLVERVEQVELVVAGTPVEDPEWFQLFVSAIESGRSSAGADLVLDLLEQVNPKGRTTDRLRKETPPLSDAAAASVYAILVALHSDLANLSNLTAPPASEYFAQNLQLRGYLNEVLARDETQYRQAVGVSLASFRGAIRAGRLSVELPPKAIVEFQSDRSIRVSLVMQLRIKVVDEVGLPLKLELVSVYKTDSSGKIYEHRLLESRVNGQLTPGDIVTQWLTKGPPSPENVVMDALTWARSLGGGPLA